MSKTVFVGLSGGVDSSVAALRLLEAGYQVVGVFIKVWHPDFLVCSWEEERLDAMRVAAHLGIPFLTCDAEAAYRDAVAHYFIESYRAGKTPNPDVMCNKTVKFGAFLDFANAHGADYIATGHYAQKGGETELLRGVDQQKDQSYFLWSLTREQLAYTLFPVGGSEKNEIRKAAQAAQLPTALKKDSQGVCFLGQIDIPKFLAHYIDLKSGVVLDEAGNNIGTHSGAFVYTVGQRHGFTVSQAPTDTAPWYIVDKDVLRNTITVAQTPPVLQAQSGIELMDIVWRRDTVPFIGETFQAQTRYRQTPFTVTVQKYSPHSITLATSTVIDKPASGQSCVLYDHMLCLGGGMIL